MTPVFAGYALRELWTHSRSRIFFGRDRKSWPLVGNVQQVMSGERRNKAIAPYVLPDRIHAVWTLPPGDADFSLPRRVLFHQRHLYLTHLILRRAHPISGLPEIGHA